MIIKQNPYYTNTDSQGGCAEFSKKVTFLKALVVAYKQQH